MKGALAAACALVFFTTQKTISFAETTGKVKVGSATVRQTADINSEPVASSSQGTTVTILNEVTDSAGTLWYEVYVDTNKNGFIRSDLIDKDASSEVASAQTSDASAAAPAGTASGAEVPAETAMDAQYATIKVPSAKIRSGASTSNGIVDSLPENSQVVISGQTAGSDKPWYYVTFTGTDGTEKTGYVRSDLVTLGDMVPVPEPEEVPQPEPEAPVDVQPEPVQNADYECVYKADENGEYAWYLYDRTSGKTYQQRLDDLLNAAHAQSTNNALDAKTVVKQRIIIIVLAVVILLLGIAVGIMIFKLREAYYEDYEDDEDEDEEDEVDEEEDRRREPRRREDRGREERSREDRRREERGREERTRADRERGNGREEPRRKSAPREDRQPAPRRKTTDSGRMPVREVSYEEEDAPVKAQPKKKAKNFMVDEDFEFEFLNMKDNGKDM